MQTAIQNPLTIKARQQSDEEQGKQLFDNLSMSDGNPFQNLQLSSQLQQSQPLEENQQNQDKEEVGDFRQMMRMSKKEKKKEKKMRKIKQAKERKQARKQNRNLNIKQNDKIDKKPTKKMMLDSEEEEADKISEKQSQKFNLKIKKNFKKTIKNSDEEQNLPSDRNDSDEYSSEEQMSESDDLGKMDPNDQNENESGRKDFKKKLSKKSRKQRILQKQGFDLRELGNDGEVNFELNQSVGESDDSFSEGENKKKSNKRVKKDKKSKIDKKPKLTNEEFLGKLQQLGREDQIDQNQSDRYNYDSGLNELEKLRPKRESNHTIKVQNKLFGDLEMDLEEQLRDEQNQENAVEVPKEKLELELKPKSVTLSKASSFLNKVEALKKHRGLEADINQEEFDKITKEKAKRSISQLMSKIQNEVQQNEEIDIEIKAPTIAKGKSADLINNTMFIVKNLSQKQSTNLSNDNAAPTGVNSSTTEQVIKPSEQQKVTKIQPVPNNSIKSKKGVSRSEFFKQIKQSISVRRSKYVSEDELKNSMKASKLQELQEIRKKIEEKRRKEALEELGEFSDVEAEDVIQRLEGDNAKMQGKSIIENRAQRTVEELQQYDEVDQDKNQKKNDAEVEEPKIVEPNVEKNNQNSNPLPIKQPEIQPLNIKIEESALQKELRIQKAMKMQGQQSQSNRHNDDMIEQYEGVDEVEKEEMDLQNQYDEEADDQEEEDQGDEQEEEKHLQQQEESKQDQMEIKNEENPELRQELEDEGIIMPGLNNKRKHKQTKPQDIDFSQYMAQNQNGQIPQPILLQPQQNQSIQKPSSKIDEETREFKEFKKLRKIAVLNQEKKKKREEQLKRAKEFFEQEAELGSDNEENDDNVKAINKKEDEEEDGDHLDQELQELIDNAVDINQADEQEAFKKYMEDVKQKDREQLQRILRGEFRRPNKDMPEMQEMEEDERNRIERMERMVEWMKKRQQDQNDLYAKDDSEDDEMNYYYDYNGNKKRIEKKKNNEEEGDGHESPDEDKDEIEKKLQSYLMDTISPAKRDTDIEIHNEIIMELPTMTKKNTFSLLNNFGKKSSENSAQPQNQTQLQSEKQKETPNKFTFAGNLLNLASNKGDSNSLPKMKKTSSHMTEYLNKNKSQKPMTFTGSTLKLPGIFGRLGKK